MACEHYNKHHFVNIQCQLFSWLSRSRQPNVIISQKFTSIQIRPAPIQPDFGKLADTQKVIDNQIKQFRKAATYRKDLAEAQQQYKKSLKEAVSIKLNPSTTPTTRAASTSNSITFYGQKYIKSGEQ